MSSEKQSNNPQDIFKVGEPEHTKKGSTSRIIGAPARAGQPWLWLGILICVLAIGIFLWLLIFLAYSIAGVPKVNSKFEDLLNPNRDAQTHAQEQTLPSAKPSAVPSLGTNKVNISSDIVVQIRDIVASTDCRSINDLTNLYFTFTAQASSNKAWTYPQATELLENSLKAINKKCSGNFTNRVLSALKDNDSPEPLRSTVEKLGTDWLSKLHGPADEPEYTTYSNLSFTSPDKNIGCTLPGDGSVTCTIISSEKYNQPVTLGISTAGEQVKAVYGGTVTGTPLNAGANVQVGDITCSVTDGSITCQNTKTKYGVFLSRASIYYTH